MPHKMLLKIISFLFPSKKNDFCEIFNHVYVVNLKKCADRRLHTIKEFARVGIKHYEFIEAADKDDPQVLQWIKSGKIAQFPPCFRCGKNRCHCVNNFLIPQQIANWCSFIKVWKDMVDNKYAFCLICEDDLKFTYHFNESITSLFSPESLKKYRIDKKRPLLIRLAKAFEKKTHSKKIWQRHRFTQEKTMSNPCFAINTAMAEILLKNIHVINHTSDVYIHKQIIEQHSEIQHFTIKPIPVYELSSSQGKIKFYSEIRPKGIDAQDKMRQKNVAVKKEYKEVLCLSHPRCGSSYASFLLTKLGLDVGHEKIGINGVSSWMLAVEDTDYPWGDIGNKKKSGGINRYYFANIIHVLRDPFSAIPSIILENQCSRNNDSYFFRRRHLIKLLNIDLPEKPKKDNEINLAALSYLAWNKLICNRKPDLVFRIEHDHEKLVQFLLEKNLINNIPHDFNLSCNTIMNANKKYIGVTYEKPEISKNEIIEKLHPEILSQLHNFLQQYGYTL